MDRNSVVMSGKTFQILCSKPNLLLSITEGNLNPRRLNKSKEHAFI